MPDNEEQQAQQLVIRVPLAQYNIEDTRDVFGPVNPSSISAPSAGAAGSNGNYLSGAVQDQQAIAEALQPSANKSSPNGLEALWSSTWGKWLLIGALTTLAIALIVQSTSHSRKSKLLPPRIFTPAQAAVAQLQLSNQTSAVSDVLKNEGYSNSTIIQAQNATEITYGSRIALATIVSPQSHNQDAMPIDVIGNSRPDQYTNLQTIKARDYIHTLSDSPTENDMTKNSAVVHGLTTEAAE